MCSVDGLKPKASGNTGVRSKRQEDAPLPNSKRGRRIRVKTPYLKQSQGLRDIEKVISTLSENPSKIEIFKLSLDDMLDFIGQERQSLDITWGYINSRVMRADSDELKVLKERSSQVSMELAKLDSAALELSVNLSITAPLFASEASYYETGYSSSNSVGSEGLNFGGADPLPPVRDYHHILQKMLNKCSEYKSVTQRAQELSAKIA